MRNLVYFLYILIKLTFFREIPTLIKMIEYLRHSEDISLVYFPFLRFFLVLFQLKRYLILVFFNNFYFSSKINWFLGFSVKMLNIDSARVAVLKKVSKIKSKGGL